jgi:flagellar hook assembly protein FlgD
VQVNLPERSAIDVAVYNIIGQVVYQTQLTNVPVGQLTLPWNGRNANGTAVASGIYFFRVTIQGASGLTSLNKIQKIVLVK